MPYGLKEGWNRLRAHLSADPETWGFWLEWYEAILDGNPLPWELSFRIATTLTDADWDAGPAHVAGRIEEIRADWEAELARSRPDSVPELEKTKLLEHVKRLLQQPDMTALAADGAADILERAIQDFLKTAPANCLPDELAHLESLPPLFRSISRLVRSSETAAVKERKLIDEIQRLNARVAALEADLKVARSRTVNGLFKASFIKALGTSLGAGVCGSTALATAHFFGWTPADWTLENLRGWLDAVAGATPAPDSPPMSLPPDYEV